MVRQFAENAQSLLTVQSQYILFLHADVFRRRKQAAVQVLDITQWETFGEEAKPSTSLFDARDLAQMEQAVKFRILLDQARGRKKEGAFQEAASRRLASRAAMALRLAIGPVPIARRRRTRAQRKRRLHKVPHHQERCCQRGKVSRSMGICSPLRWAQTVLHYGRSLKFFLLLPVWFGHACINQGSWAGFEITPCSERRSRNLGIPMPLRKAFRCSGWAICSVQSPLQLGDCSAKLFEGVRGLQQHAPALSRSRVCGCIRKSRGDYMCLVNILSSGQERDG